MAGNNQLGALDLGSMIQPLTSEGIFNVQDYHCWGPQITKGDDNKYYLIYSRWIGQTVDWLTSSEVALAVIQSIVFRNGPNPNAR